LWRSVETGLLDAVNARSSDAVATRVRKAIARARARDASLRGQGVEIDAAHEAIFFSYECGALAKGGRLWILTRDDDGRWGATATLTIADGEHAALLAAAPGRLAVLGTVWATQHRTSHLQIVRPDGGRLGAVFDRAGLMEFYYGTSGDSLSFTWSEPMASFGESADGPLRRYEGMESGAPGAAVLIRSQTPWLDALDAACRRGGALRKDRRNLCGQDAVVDEVRLAGDFAVARLRGPDADVACGREAPGSGIVGDRATVVELARDGAKRWRIVDVRSEDRGCATTLAAVAGSTGKRFARGDTNTALYLARGQAFWTIGERLVGEVAASRPLELRDVAATIAVGEDGVYWISAETGRLRRVRHGGEAEALGSPPNTGDSLAIVAGQPYWASYLAGEIRTLERGRVRVVADGLDAPWGLAVVGTSLVVATADGIHDVNVTNGEVATVPLPALAPVGVAAHQGTIAWTEAGGRVMLAVPGEEVRILATGGRPTAIIMDDYRVLWADANDRSIRQVRYGVPARARPRRR
jgi:hypothetical protein